MASSDVVIAFELSSDITRKLALSDSDKIAIAVNGTAVFIRQASHFDFATVPTYRHPNGQICFNVHKDFLPDASVPVRPITLPHYWSFRDVLQIDTGPLKNHLQASA